jgi:hypothetical protein
MSIYQTLPNSQASGVVENLDRRTKPSNNDSLSNTQAYGNPIPLVHDEIEAPTGLMESNKPNTYSRFSAQEETSPVRPEQPVTDIKNLFNGIEQEVSQPIDNGEGVEL